MAEYDMRQASYQLVHDLGRLEVSELDRRPPSNSPAPKAQ